MTLDGSLPMGEAQIADDGWAQYNIWRHSGTVRDLYLRRARDEAPEMTCAAQACDLLADLVAPGDSVLDVGCGTGYFFHSLRRRNLPVSYLGIDSTPEFIEIGRRELAGFGLDRERLKVLRIEDLAGQADHVLCLNVLSNLDNFYRPLERLLKAAAKSLVLRESIAARSQYAYVRDAYLDPGVDLKVYVNAYARSEIFALIESYGFVCREVTDRRSGGKPEMVIGYPHYWTFVVATRA